MSPGGQGDTQRLEVAAEKLVEKFSLGLHKVYKHLVLLLLYFFYFSFSSSSYFLVASFFTISPATRRLQHHGVV